MKILSFTPLPYGDGSGWWGRDLALTTLGFRTLGHDASLVCLRTTHLHDPSHRPVLLITPEEARSPSWWKSQKPDLVILGLWTRPKYDSIRRAALSATPHVIERADSDGMRTASCGLTMFGKRRYEYFRDRTYRWPAAFSIPASLLYSALSVLATPWTEARLAKTLKLLPALTVETPLATDLWRKLAVKLGADPERIHCIPHPVQTELFRLDSSIQKGDRIISVGRWEAYQKNFPLLKKTLALFLNKNPGWTAVVVGSGLPIFSLHARITYIPALCANELARLMQGSKFFFSSSRFESFGLAAAEALCCGCLPVGPPQLGSFDFLHTLIALSPQQRVALKIPDSLEANYGKLAEGADWSIPSKALSPSSVANSFIQTSNLIRARIPTT